MKVVEGEMERGDGGGRGGGGEELGGEREV